MSLVSLSGVDAENVETVWPQILPLIRTVTDRSGDDPQEILHALTGQKAQLVLGSSTDGIEAICVTELVTVHNRYVCNCWIIAGRKRENWLHYLNELESWAKSKGCVAMRHAQARTGWKRILKPQGYRVTRVVLEKEL